MSAAGPSATLLELRPGHGPAVGAGHLARGLALAQAWIAAGGVARLVAPGLEAGNWWDRFAAAGVEVLGPGRTAPLGAPPADVVAVDDYRAGSDLLAALRTHARVLLVDDHAAGGARPADWLLDQNLGATRAEYVAAPPPERCLLGSRYALLRREVAAALPPAPPDRSRPPRRLLVAMGGDPSTEVRVAVAGAVERLVAAHGLEPVWLEGVDDVGRVLAGVDVAVSAAGSTCWELCAFGVPAAVVAVAANQAPIARALGAAGAAIDCGDLGPGTTDALAAAIDGLVAAPDRRAAMAAVGRDLVDGRGAERVVAALRAG